MSGMSDAEKKKNFLKKHGLKAFNVPVLTNEGGKKGKVGILEDGKPRLIRFGDSSMGHNYSPEARRSFRARHGKNIKEGKGSAAYWANKVLWSGPSGSKKSPPKSQKNIKGSRYSSEKSTA
tara:strand:- start:2292 stop:2654 length:363 start_codon:yes stop_codon:yes gene_type:complete